jgi:histidine ammonia-lyase
MDSTPELTIRSAADLDQAAVVRVARENARISLDDALVRRIEARRERVLAALSAGTPVYGVNTGMGAFSHRALGQQAQRAHQEALLLARAVGGPPWLHPAEVRAVLAVRLRTFLNNDSGVSGELCRRLVALLDRGVCPAVPRTAMGVAGEIIALAHLAAPLTAHRDGDGAGAGGRVLGPGGDAVAAGPVLRAAGIEPYRLGPKEGVALIEGVPVTTALAIMCADDAGRLLRAATTTLAAEFALTGASRDTLAAELARGDNVLGEVTAELRRLSGTVSGPRALQPPVSFRVSADVLAHLRRALGQLAAAVKRALDGVTDSPAFLDEAGGRSADEAGSRSAGTADGRFTGTAGFSGYDLAAYLHLVTVALIGAAEVAAARLHRLMDPAVSGQAAQLAADPGRHTGLSPVHKRAVGVVHSMRRLALPATVGTVETSAGQEDVQSFSLEAAQACRDALAGLADVVACEQLAIHQMRLLGAPIPGDAAPGLTALLDRLAALLPATTTDRPWGHDLTTLRTALPGLTT